MDTFFSQLSSLSLLSITVRLLLTTVFAGTLGYERERHRQAAGFRTYIIVADAAALVMMTNLYIGDVFGSTDLVRMPASVITGLGFLGAGTILVTKSHEIKGLTTAAGLWAVSIIGTAIGAGFYTGGTVCYAFILLAMNVLRLVDVRIQSRQKTATVYFELRSKLSIGQLVRLAREKDCTLSELELYADSGYGDNLVCGTFTLWAEGRTSLDDILRELSAVEGVIYLTRIRPQRHGTPKRLLRRPVFSVVPQRRFPLQAGPLSPIMEKKAREAARHSD